MKSASLRGRPLLLLLSLSVAAGGPCDIYGDAGSPCVCAVSVTRALFAGYAGALYQVRRRSDNASLDVGVVAPGGIVNASAQDAFCGVPPPAALPALGSNVTLHPWRMPTSAFTHCEVEGYAALLGSDNINASWDASHAFTVVAALNGAPGAFSLASLDTAGAYIAPVAAGGSEPGRVGVVVAPAAADASWALAPAASGGGLALQSLGRGGFLALGTNLTGACVPSHFPPWLRGRGVFLAGAAAVAAAPAAAAWLLRPYRPARDPDFCVIERIYDQSGRANDFVVSGPGGASPYQHLPVRAGDYPITLSGSLVYGAFFLRTMGYRVNASSGIPAGNDAETLSMVVSGFDADHNCCFDFGNAERSFDDTGPGHMESIYFGTTNATDKGWCGGVGAGPWIFADLEDGLWACNESGAVNPRSATMDSAFVVAMLKGGTDSWAIKGGDATVGALATQWDGPRPNGYQPMRKEGSLVLGTGGDGSAGGIGVFFEGLVLAGYSADAADAAVARDIAAAGYGQ